MKKATMFSPELLLQAGVPVFRAIQQPGDFVVTFPKSYHGGFNIAEAVNFATSSWYPFGMEASKPYSNLLRPCVIPLEELIVKDVLHNSEATASGWIVRDAKVAHTFVQIMRNLVSHKHRFSALPVVRWHILPTTRRMSA